MELKLLIRSRIVTRPGVELDPDVKKAWSCGADSDFLRFFVPLSLKEFVWKCGSCRVEGSRTAQLPKLEARRFGRLKRSLRSSLRQYALQARKLLYCTDLARTIRLFRLAEYASYFIAKVSPKRNPKWRCSKNSLSEIEPTLCPMQQQCNLPLKDI